MKHVLAIFIVLLLACSSFADEMKSDQSFIEWDDRPLNLYSLDLPRQENKHSLLSQVTFNHRARGVIKAKYVGLHSIIASQAEKRLKRYSRRQIRILFNNSNMSISETQARFAASNSKYNPYGEWWERPWWASLPPEKGGAPIKQTEIQIGQEFNLPNWQIVHWGQRQIRKLGDIWVTNDHLYEGIEDGDTISVPGEQFNELGSDRLNKYNGRSDADVVIDQTPWFLGDIYHFRFKPSLRIRGGPDVDDIVDEVSLRFVVELYAPGQPRNHFGDLSFFVRYNIPDNEAFASVTFDLAAW